MNGIKTTDWNVIREFIKRDATPAKDFELKIIRNDKELVFKSFMITLDINSQERMSESGMCKNLKEK